MRTIWDWLGAPPKLTFGSILVTVAVAFLFLSGIGDAVDHRYYLASIEVELGTALCFIGYLERSDS